MTNSGMLVCSFFLKKRFSREKAQTFNLNQEIVCKTDEDTKHFADFFEMATEFCNRNTAFVDDKKARKMFSVKEGSLLHYDEATYHAMSFVIQSGSYGVEADMTNRHTMKVSYHRTEDEADIKSFLCIIYIPKDMEMNSINKGIFVFQSIATYGVKTITVDLMRSFFKELGVTLETRSVSVHVFLQKLIEQGSLNKITFYKDCISPNTADNILISTGREERTYTKPHLQPEWLSKMLSIFKKADETGIVEIPDEDFDDLSIQFKLGSRFRTVRLRNLDKLSIVEDIPDEIVSKDDNSATISHMIQTANEYKQHIVFDIKNGE